MLDKLATVQLPADELRKYTSITNVQTKGLKKHLLEARKDVVYTVSEDTQTKWSSLAGGSKKMKRLALLHGFEKKILRFIAISPNVLCQS